MHELSLETLEKVMKCTVYLEVTNKKDSVLLFAAVNTPFPVRKPTTERLALFYHMIAQCGRLTSLQKVSPRPVDIERPPLRDATCPNFSKIWP